MTAAPSVLANVTSMQPARRLGPLVEAITATVATAIKNTTLAAISANRPVRGQRNGSESRLDWSIMIIAQLSLGPTAAGSYSEGVCGCSSEWPGSGANASAAELMQKRCPPGPGPSSKT